MHISDCVYNLPQVQLLEREVVSRGSYWRRSTHLMEDRTSHLETVSGCVQSSGADLDCERSRQQLKAVSMSSKELVLVCTLRNQKARACVMSIRLVILYEFVPFSTSTFTFLDTLSM